MKIVPEYRNRGVMTQIMKASLQDLAAKGYRYVFSMSAAPVTLMSQMAMGWRSIGSLQLMRYAVTEEKKSFPRVRKMLKKSPLVVSLYRRVRGIESKPRSETSGTWDPFNEFDCNFDQRRHQIDAPVAVEPAPRPQAMADLVARIGSDERVQHVRDAQYFAWRYQNPYGFYRFLFWGDSPLQGYLVLRVPVLAYPSCYMVVDWEASNESVRADLMRTLLRLDGFEAVGTWSATLGNDRRRLLEETGFEQVQESLPKQFSTVLVHSLDGEQANTEWLLGNQRLLDLKNWDLRMIYSEGY